MSTLFRMNVIWKVCPEIEEARRLLERHLAKKDKDLVVTSANDSQHSNGSLHPSGKAFDIRRIPQLLTGAKRIFNIIKSTGILEKDIIYNAQYNIYHIEFDI